MTPTRAAFGVFRQRSYSLAQARAMAEAHAAGASARQLARQYGVTVRTVWRALARASEPHRVIVVDDWQAEFALTPVGPVQTSPWVPR